jgi:transcription initiation factor IIE alpha subunit
VNLATLMESTRIELTVLYLQRQAKYENMEEHETQHVTASLYMEEPEYRNGIAWENMNIEMSLRHHMEELEYRNVITCKNMNTEMQLRLLA